MALRAGRLRHTITIQTPTDGVSADYSDATETWGALTGGSNIHAAIEPLAGRELWTAQQVNPAVTHQVTIRYLSTVTPKMRVIFGSRTFQIVSVITPLEVTEQMQLLCTEEVA